MGADLIFLVWLGISGLIYIPTGILLLWWSNKKPIRNRSPFLVSIIHWSNFLETCLFLVTLYLYFHGDHHSFKLEIAFQISQTFLHCSFIIPYILRCYRIYFIFHLDQDWDEKDSNWRQHLYKASQAWLFKIYCICMAPVIAFSMSIFIIPGFQGYFPTSYYDRSEFADSITEMVYLFVLFIEELAFVLCVYMLRTVNDDYKMTKEIAVVCLLWTINGVISTFPSNIVWMIEGTIRNNLIMLVSSLYPVLSSIRGDSFDDAITLEALQSLDLVLQNRVTLDTFEKALIKEIPKMTKIKAASEYLQIWLKCEYYQNCPSFELECEIMASSKMLDHFKANNINVIQFEAYKVLAYHLFPLFKKTKVYQNLLKNVIHQQIYINRILQTSFTLKSDLEYSITSQSFDLITNSNSLYFQSPSLLSQNQSGVF
ncbi:unnamed protein product [Blepharisma stoltei]|uniref:RGS domain-containing protein n=1 Tax=Blepharisma stoltei TaxID=1481888 RepID=A0AAU9I5A0_9CILI|nr:unnamed protein product [Blepharisma stoltei]